MTDDWHAALRYIRSFSISVNGYVSTSSDDGLDVDPEPYVESNLYPSGATSGGVGQTGTFTLESPEDDSVPSSFVVSTA